ncbi:MAG TPA: malonyl-CoA decarboxylase family protein [Thermoanaerobaculia bacterium]|jgi:malonyl-CoA decarboxylase
MKRGLLNGLFGLLGRDGTGGSASLAVLAEALLSGRGQVSGAVLARQLFDGYAALPQEGRLGFLRMLASDFGADPVRLEKAITAYRSRPGARTALVLHTAAEARRQELFRRLNRAPGGTRDLVRMREDVLRGLDRAPELGVVDEDFVHLFSSWFNPGFLVLRRIDWSTPAQILEKIIRYEAVHAITSWDDLRRRLDPPDRRCFAFFHPALEDEPLIFVEVALADEIPAAIAPLLAEGRRPLPLRRATTAVFYSTSNCQAGLKGISFGHFLLKRVAEELKADVPSLKTFVTLSPMPGFSAWLGAGRERMSRGALTAAVAEYLLIAEDASGRPADPVARFHLGNGARLERINWMGDPSPHGLETAAGFMANYLYDLSRAERNHELFENRGERVASRAVRRLLRRPR